MRSVIHLGLLGAVMALGLHPAIAAEGPFTQAQLDAGGLLYNDHCRECHAKDGAGALGPKLSGDQFRQMFGGQPVANLRDWIFQNMPQNAPGTLPDAQLDPILAYILSLNGYAPGQTALSADTAKTVQFDPK
ncbi:c-type cytochrome [Hansschlegelia zhihuaiae]|uniref:Cytochrome c n=1 Tax=Hansschlegelia zhihuaiae TaxID=405005 RepID=A0A4Q0MDB5_9HYPH|nr:c-type cytochrome [Hansschlegelia zhihuaiae]RXF70796.1 cytochrome c [Hansschlegelia zhihuaiae]